MTRPMVNVKVTGLLKLLQFSKSISSAIYNGSWQMTTNSETRAQYLNLIGLNF